MNRSCSRSRSLSLPLPLLAAVVAAAFVADGQAQSRLDRDVRFVRSLARDLRFVALAQDEIEHLKKTYTQADDFKMVSQLGIEVSLIGARVKPNREERRTLYNTAIEQSEEVVNRYADEPVGQAARMTLVEACYDFGTFLIEEIDIANVEAPDKVAELEEQAAATFRRGVEACDKLMEALAAKKDTDERANIDYHLVWMLKGKLLREHGRAVKKDAKVYGDRALASLEDLVFSIGEETALGMRALFERAQVVEVMGNLDEALVSYQDVIRAAMNALKSEELDLPGEVRDLMVIMMEEAYDRLALVLLQQGNLDEVIAQVEQYRADMVTAGSEVTKFGQPGAAGAAGETVDGKEDERFGHSLYITQARAMYESGKAELVATALERAKYFNAKHPNDWIGLRAKELIKDILSDSASTSFISVDLLLEVAKGDYQAKNYELAIQGYKKVIAAMSAGDRPTRAIEAYVPMARSFALQDRFLEAVVALKLGLEQTTAKSPATEEAAELLQSVMRRLRADARNDKYFDKLNDEITALTARFGSVASEAKIFWDEGNQAILEKNYAKAAEAYAKVPRDSNYSELAQARRAMAQRLAGDFAKARQVIADYRAWLQTKEAVLPPGRNELVQMRNQAQAEIDFTEGYMLYQEATGDELAKGQKDATKYPEAIRVLSDFVARYEKTAPQHAERALFFLGRSHIETGELAKAEEKYRMLRKLAPNSELVPALASAVFRTYYTQIEAQKRVVEQARTDGDAAKIKAARDKYATLLKAGLACGLDYLGNSENPQFGLAYNTLQYAFELQDWAQVQQLGAKLVSRFETSENAQERLQLQTLVKPLVGEALLKERKWREAYEMLAAAEKANAEAVAQKQPNAVTDYPLKRLVCLALGGWAELDERGTIRAYTGLGKPGEAWEKYYREYQEYALNPSRAAKFSYAWYKFQFESYWFALKAAEKGDTTFKGRAQQIYSIAESIDKFETLKNLRPGGNELFILFRDNPPPR